MDKIYNQYSWKCLTHEARFTRLKKKKKKKCDCKGIDSSLITIKAVNFLCSSNFFVTVLVWTFVIGPPFEYFAARDIIIIIIRAANNTCIILATLSINRPIQVHRVSQLRLHSEEKYFARFTALAKPRIAFLAIDAARVRRLQSSERERTISLEIPTQHPSSHANNAKLSRPLSGTGVDLTGVILNLLHSLLEFKRKTLDNFLWLIYDKF